MDKELTTLSSKGQLVIPKSFRQRLHLAEGDYIGMVLVDDIIAIKKVELPKERVTKKIKKLAAAELSFEELLYPEKKK